MNYLRHLIVLLIMLLTSTWASTATSQVTFPLGYYSQGYYWGPPYLPETTAAGSPTLSVALSIYNTLTAPCTVGSAIIQDPGLNLEVAAGDGFIWGKVAVPQFNGTINNQPCSGLDGSNFVEMEGYTYDPGRALGSGARDGGEGNCNCSNSKFFGAPVVADPIDAAIGNKFIQEDDYPNGGWLTFRRFYNSHQAILSSAMGGHWRHSFDRSLGFLPGYGAVTGIKVLRPDGQVEVFGKANNGSWAADPDIADTLVEHDNAQGIATSYTFFVSALRQYETYSASGALQTVIDETGNGVTLTYSDTSTPVSIAPSPGLLLTVADPKGRQLKFIYNSNGQMASVTLPDGKSFAYAYDSSNDLTSVQYPDGKSRQYVYGESTLTNGDTNTPYLLTGVIDETGTRYESNTYDFSLGATETTLPGGVSDTQIAQNGNDRMVTYPLGNVVDFGYSLIAGRNLISSIDSPCNPQCDQSWQSRSYDANGYPQSYIDFNGNTTAFTYSSAGLLLQQIDAQGDAVSQRTINMTWNTALRVPLTRQVLDVGGKLLSSTQWVYNSAGQTIAHCEIDPTNNAASGYSCSNTGSVPAGVRRWTYTYCTAVGTGCPLVGLMLTVTGPRTDLSQTRNYSYYTNSSATSCGTPGAACYQTGDLHTVTDALGHVVTIASYDADGRVTRITDSNGVNTDLTYTPRGWLASRIVGGANTTFGYTAYGAVQTISDPDGVTTTFGYDVAHRLVKITDALGNYVQYTLDAAGNKTAENVYDASGTLRENIARTFNNLGQLLTVTDGLGKTVFAANGDASGDPSYDYNGNLVLSTDALGIERQLNYDALNRLVQTLDNYNGTDPSTKNTTTGYVFDTLDRLTQVTDPSNLNTTYSYDGLSDATGQVSPDTGTNGRTFDAAGNVLTKTDAKGIVATNTYDALDRLITTGYPDSTQSVTYAYDDANSVTGCSTSYPKGRLTRIIENSVTTLYCYDALGRVVQKKATTAAATDTVGYSYTAAGRLSGVVYSDGTMVSYTRDGDGRIQSVSVTPPGGSAGTVVSHVTYQPFGPVSGYTLGNGQTIARVFDANYRLTDLTSPAFNLHVARDAMGDITAIGNAAGANPATETYSYDPLYRLTAITEASGTVLESVTYNSTGDRLSKTGSGLATGTYNYNPNTHQLTATGNAARTVDADGNTTAISEASSTYGFGFSDRNRLTVAQLAGNTIATYNYNALDQRIGKIVSSTTERYDFDEDSQMLGEYGQTKRDYIWMDGIPVANVDTSGTTSTIAYVTADELGTPRAVANSSGTTEWTLPYQSNPWNEVAPTTTGYTYNLRFPGQYADAETGLFYNDERYYDSASGRFTQTDPTGINGGLDLYVYGDNSPLMFIDPLGLFPFGTPAPATGPTSPAYPGVVPQDPLAPPSRIPSPTQALKALATICAAQPQLCVAAVGIGLCMYPTSTADSCTDEPHPPAECQSNEDRCEQNLRRDMETCNTLGKMRGKNTFKICEQQAMLRYGNCLSERDGDDGINAPLPPWRLH